MLHNASHRTSRLKAIIYYMDLWRCVRIASWFWHVDCYDIHLNMMPAKHQHEYTYYLHTNKHSPNTYMCTEKFVWHSYVQIQWFWVQCALFMWWLKTWFAWSCCWKVDSILIKYLSYGQRPHRDKTKNPLICDA